MSRKTLIRRGDYVDVKSLLSTQARDYLVTTKHNARVPISSLDGNYVLVVPFSECLPIKEYSDDACIYQSIQALYSQLSLQGIAHLLKVVLVPKLAPGFTEHDFRAFFSGSSVDCLTIPFSDSGYRQFLLDSVCMHCLLVDPNGIVLQHDYLFLSKYGPQSFPFSREKTTSIDNQYERIRNMIRASDSPILTQILKCNYLSQIGDENKTIPTSELGNRPVGLYLYFDGKRMDMLRKTHKKCLEVGQKFEIVLVPLPFGCLSGSESFYNLMKQSAMGDSASSSWWAFPFNDNICRTLWRLIGGFPFDGLIILPNHDLLGDLDGMTVMLYYGVIACPFSRDAVAKKKVKDLKSLYLEQLLGVDNTRKWNLKNKNVLLIFDDPNRANAMYAKTVTDDYKEILRSYPGCEIVFISLKPESDVDSSWLSATNWHKLPAHQCESVTNQIFMKDVYPDESPFYTLVSFGKDGKILSRFAGDCLPSQTSSASLFEDTLLHEILYNTKRELDLIFPM